MVYCLCFTTAVCDKKVHWTYLRKLHYSVSFFGQVVWPISNPILDAMTDSKPKPDESAG